MNRWKRKLNYLTKITNMKFFKWVLFIFMAIFLFAIMYGNIRPEQLNVSLFSISDKTIRAPITIEDQESTEKKRREAVEQVQDVYVLKQEYAQNRVDLISSIFDTAMEVQEEVLNKRERSEKVDSERELENDIEPTAAEKVEMLKSKLTDTVVKDLSNSSLLALVNASKNELAIAKDSTVTAVNNVMSKRIPADEVENAKKRVEDEIRFTSLSSDLKNAAIELGRYAIVQNEFYDPEATEELRKQAAENVEPVKILQGQIIVEQGQLITSEIYRQLKLLGLLDTHYSFLPIIGLLLFVFIMVGVIYANFYSKTEREKQVNPQQLLMFSFIFIISMVFMKGFSFIKPDFIEITYLFPAAMCAMLMKILISDSAAVLSTIVLSLCGSIIFNGEASGSFHISASMYILISGISSIIFLTNQNYRSKIFQAGLFVSAVNMIVITVLLFIPNSQLTYFQYGYYYLMAIGSGIGSAVLTIGLLPFFEAGFGILSTMKLIELSNPNHPLLKKILTEAPGTYHHSVMVANLADAACEAIGANGLLARVGCYYHDIGKTKRPIYFIENQINIPNPHDQLPPEKSKDIIIAHAREGAEILKKHDMPKEIIDIALEHHGTTLLKYFYVKAKEMNKDVKEEDFRYPGPKPQTKEALIIGIADSVEAAVRSMTNPDSKKIEAVVKNIIKERLNDGQMDECDITLKELAIVEKTLCETLHGIFHNRIEYPDLKK